MIFSKASKLVLRSTQPLVQLIPAALSRGVKRPGREADHSPLYTVEVKNAYSCTYTPTYVFVVWCLTKYKETPLILQGKTAPRCVHRLISIRSTVNVQTALILYLVLWIILYFYRSAKLSRRGHVKCRGSPAGPAYLCLWYNRELYSEEVALFCRYLVRC
jgi:hypothetical protein